MRVLLWYWGRRGGGAQFALGLARALSLQPGLAVRLSLSAQLEGLEAFHALGVPMQIVETYRSRAGFLAALPHLPARRRALLTAAGEADVVLSAMTHLWTPLIAPALALGGHAFVPVVHDAMPHPGDANLFWDWRLGREVGAARAAVALSDSVAHALAARAPGLPLIRMALPALVTPSASKVPQDGPPTFVFFGRLRAYKGLDLLRDAWALFQPRHPDSRLLVMGEGDANACAPGLAALAGVTIKARWVAEHEIAALLGQATAVVLPYREASQSGVVPQALALGVPVVATPVGGLVEQVREGAGGVVATTVTATALADAMARVLAPGALPLLRAEARAAAAGATDWDGAAATLVDGLRTVMTSAPASGMLHA